MEDFAGRDAPLEYWFLKVVSGDLAFLVDWIVRKELGEAEVRVSSGYAVAAGSSATPLTPGACAAAPSRSRTPVSRRP